MNDDLNIPTKKKYPKKGIIAVIVIFLMFSPLFLCFMSDDVKGDYTDETDEISSYIAWITLYDQNGDIIVNWTSLNDDVSPNVNSQEVQIGYWALGVYFDESDGGFTTHAYNAVSLYIQFKNITSSLAWYPNPINQASYVTSEVDHGTYRIIQYKTPDWETQMTYDWWRLDSALSVNASLYINSGDTGLVSVGRRAYTSQNNLTWSEARNDWAGNIFSNYGGVKAWKDGSYYFIVRQYCWFVNTGEDMEVSIGGSTYSGNGNALYIMVYDGIVEDTTYIEDYYNMSNWYSEPIHIRYPASGKSITQGTFTNNGTYGTYILMMVCQSADYLDLGALGTTNYYLQMTNFYAYSVPNNWSLAYSFEQEVINHTTYEMDSYSIVYLLLAFLPAVALGYFIGRSGVILGLSVMSLILGFTMSNYFWVMAITLGFCAIMLFKGDIINE